MLRGLLRRNRDVNRWYDGLEKERPTFRMMIFMIPAIACLLMVHSNTLEWMIAGLIGFGILGASRIAGFLYKP